jgi:hypothetical protein
LKTDENVPSRKKGNKQKKLRIKILVLVCILKATEEKSRVLGPYPVPLGYASADLDLYQNVTDPGSGTQLYSYFTGTVSG